MKLAEVEIDVLLDGFVNFFDEGAGLANEQDFFLRMCSQPVDKPFDLLFKGWAFLSGWVERVKNGLALGKALQGFAGVAKHDPPGAKTIDNIFGKLGTVGRGEGFFFGVLCL